MCFLTDGAFALEPMVVEGCWDIVPKAGLSTVTCDYHLLHRWSWLVTPQLGGFMWLHW